jgi:hypothetical protein
MAVNTPYVTLNDGNKMPQVGFGLWKVDNATCADTVYNAIKTGYRLFDGACGTYALPLISSLHVEEFPRTKLCSLSHRVRGPQAICLKISRRQS